MSAAPFIASMARPTTRWCSPTTATSCRAATFHGAPVALAADLLGHRPGAAGDDQRAAHRSAGQSGAERPAGVPHARRRAAFGLHDGAGDGRGAGVGAQDARASGERGHDPDLGQQGRPRQHEHGARRSRPSARSSSRTRVVADRDCSARARRSTCSRRSPRRRALARVHALVRARVPTLDDDRPPAPDIDAIAELIADGALERACALEVK